MNWYKQAKLEVEPHNQEEQRHPYVLDTQLLCCGYPENRRQPGTEWDRKDGINYPPENQKHELTDSHNPK